MGYEQNYVERDIRYISGVDNIVGFRNVLRLLAARTGQILNVSQVARDAALPVKTAFRYLDWRDLMWIKCGPNQQEQPETKRTREQPSVTGKHCRSL